MRADLCAEAIRLARVLARLMPDESEARGLLALCLATDARRAARYDAGGSYVSLEEHDRSLYDAAAAAEADELVRGTLAQGPGPYALQAAIASLHTLAPSFAETDWEQIAALYALLERSDPRRSSRSTARSRCRSPSLRKRHCRCSTSSPGSSRTTRPSTRRSPTCSAGCGDATAARAAYVRALELTDNPGEREFLERRLAGLVS